MTTATGATLAADIVVALAGIGAAYYIGVMIGAIIYANVKLQRDLVRSGTRRSIEEIFKLIATRDGMRREMDNLSKRNKSTIIVPDYIPDSISENMPRILAMRGLVSRGAPGAVA